MLLCRTTKMAVFHVLLSFGVKAVTIQLFLVFVAFLGYCLYVKYIHMKYDHIPGPPRGSFFLGHSPTFMRIMKNDGLIHDKLLEWSETFGSVYRLNALHYVFVCVTCPEATKEILMSPKYLKDDFIYKRLCNLFGQRLFGNGLVTSRDHKQWYKQRRIMDPAFSSLYLRGLTGTFSERVERLMDKLGEAADNNTEANMQKLLSCVTLDVIAKVAFGMDLDPLSKSSPFPKAIELCLSAMTYHIRDFTFQYNPKNRRFIKEAREACRLLRKTGAQVIQERKTAMQNDEDVPKDILTQIIKTASTEENMTEEDEEFMLDNFVTFFIAGQETTANQLAFCVMELGRHPEILEKVRKEVDDVIGMKQDISYEDLGKLSYLSQVLKETLRMYSTSPGLSRILKDDMVIDGLHIPGGAICMHFVGGKGLTPSLLFKIHPNNETPLHLRTQFSSYAAGRMEKFFEDPLKFDPDRFHPDAPKPYYCYYPFALGPRSCLGQNFAQMEAKVVMAKLLQRFEFTLVPGQTFDIVDTGMLRPKSGVVCTIKHRK